MDTTKILVFDVETTGTDKQKDQVIELCAQFGLGEDAESVTWRIRPETAINPGAQAVHGISAADLAPCPLFAELADEIRTLFAQAEMLVGYNLRFDIDMLQAEYSRLRQAPLELGGKLIVDPYRLWQNSEPRSLMDAHRRFVGCEFEAAHSAAADVAATGRVLLGMISHFALPSDWNEVADICEPERAFWIGGSGHVRFSETGDVVFGFGKHSGVLLTEMAAGPDSGYLKWLIGKDFPPHVVALCEAALSLDSKGFSEFVAARYLAPSETTSPKATTKPSVEKERGKTVSQPDKASIQAPNKLSVATDIQNNSLLDGKSPVARKTKKPKKPNVAKKLSPSESSPGAAQQTLFDL